MVVLLVDEDRISGSSQLVSDLPGLAGRPEQSGVFRTGRA